jgi:two-component sensor histidine kinase
MATADSVLQAVLDLAPDAVFLLDQQQTTIAFANDRAGRLLGRRANDLLERSLLEVLGGEPAAALRFLKRASASGSPVPGRLTLLTPAGPLRVHAYAAAVHTGGTRLIALRCVERHPVSRLFRALEARLARLRSELYRERRFQSELQQALEERDTLLAEVHHRVRNTLQVMTSFLNLQMSKYAAGPSRDALRDAQARIQALALVHNQLYRESNLDRIDLARLLPSLGQNVIKLYGASDRVTLSSSLRPWPVPVARASPLALLVTEAVTNALKHAFPGGRSGTIRLEASQAGDRPVLRIADNGIGMDLDERVDDRRTIGLDVIQALAGQLDADLEIDGDQGVEVRLTFQPAPDPQQRSPT